MRISYANIASTLALVVALSGGAYAVTQLPHNSVGTAQLKKSAVSSKKVKDHSLKAKDIGAGQAAAAVTGTPMGGGLTGAFPNPSVDLAGLTGVVKGTRLYGAATLPPSPGPTTLLSVPGVGTIKATCGASGSDRQVTISVADVPAAFDYVITEGSAVPGSFVTLGNTVSKGATVNFSNALDPAPHDARTFHLVVVDGGPATVVDVNMLTNVAAGACRVSVTAEVPA